MLKLTAADAAHDAPGAAALGTLGAVGQRALAAALVADVFGSAWRARLGFVAGIEGGVVDGGHGVLEEEVVRER